jgi:hypothetical protein
MMDSQLASVALPGGSECGELAAALIVFSGTELSEAVVIVSGAVVPICQRYL